jgi:HK97 family phage major capsid protein
MTSFLDGLQRRRADTYTQAQALLHRAQTEGRTSLTGPETRELSGYTETLRGLDEHIAELRDDETRGQIPEKYRNLGRPGRRSADSGRIDCRPGSEVMPIDFGVEQLRAAHAKVLRQEPALLETRASNTASPLLPAELYPIPTFPIHEGRIADRLPAFALDAPSLEYIQVNSVTGAAAVVPEGTAKPEITLNTTKITAAAVKIAAHLGLSWESIQDWDAFTASATTELQRLVIDEENTQILSWLNTTGILTHAATAAPTPPASSYSDIEQAIAQLRVGPALATANLLILNPASWSAIRRQTNTLGNFLIGDVTSDQVDQVWGVEVLETTVVPDGEGWLLDTTKFGRLAVRETLAVRIGYSGTDFVQNILRYVCEERCVLTVERPAAVLHITTLPTTAATASTKK